jgi:TonB family protein
MSQHQSGIFYLQNADGNSTASFPEELRSSFGERVEPKFTMLFCGLLVIIGGIVFTLSYHKVSESTSDQDILKIQERYASIVLNQPKPKAVVPEKIKQVTTSAEEKAKPEEKAEAKKINRDKETYAQREERRTGSSQTRQEARQVVEQQVQSTGIFAVITAGGSGSSRGTSSSVHDLLGEGSEGIGDLSNIKITKGTFASKNVDIGDIKARRGQVTSDVDIGRSDVGTASVTHIAQRGSVKITSPPPIIKGTAEALASRSMSSIRNVINLENNKLKRVFETWLKRDPALGGQLKVKFTILPSGEVSNVAIINSSTNNSAFDETIVRYVQRWTFDPVSGGGPVEITCPLAFEGDGQQG